jgi:glutamate synthase (NADPH) large chain
VVVLGRAGRNFAAGMTGGIAYVLDEAGEFSNVLCNKSSVDLEPIFDPTDQQIVHDLIVQHVEVTGSRRGKWILEHWLQMLPKFVKVFPHEYKRVLGTKPAAESFPASSPQPPVPQPRVVHG